ncbi:type I 3-dehydroquinate dehydratase [Haloprofundus sp. MHR1]|uniref:type I 3-dehydroquinate dehydratase n=1 Tax=Haloprofundus sp. MHR1 TaxID=2572921 RepID=UPI0010BF4417|nr:type I 3-dehydroquinate dehydratase [Haloprofundus sp. MHR1]QCJ47510.1 type I 3-dehydroquinate dehydratase [Haloprofundus sp. MHR1]
MEFDSFTLAASTDDLGPAQELAVVREHADIVEFRLDLAGDPLEALDDYDGDLPVLVTNRPEWEGGEASDDGRLATLEAAFDHDAVVAVDVELAALGPHGPDVPSAVDLRSTARERGLTVVTSVHDFRKTPAMDNLRSLLSAACEAGDVGKLAVTAADRADSLALLSVTHEATAAGHRVATMAMGEPGRHTRAVAPVYGSKIGYAPPRAENATAPGQYDLQTLAELVRRL